MTDLQKMVELLKQDLSEGKDCPQRVASVVKKYVKDGRKGLVYEELDFIPATVLLSCLVGVAKRKVSI